MERVLHDHNRGLVLEAEHSQRELVVLAKKLLGPQKCNWARRPKSGAGNAGLTEVRKVTGFFHFVREIKTVRGQVSPQPFSSFLVLNLAPKSVARRGH